MNVSKGIRVESLLGKAQKAAGRQNSVVGNVFVLHQVHNPKCEKYKQKD